MRSALDLFAGIGGWSAAAAETLGPDTQFTAVDVDTDVLTCYRANHPHVKTVHRTLPSDVSDLLPDDRSLFWMFASPPCTKLSVANTAATTEEREEALIMIEWAVKLMMETECKGWWLEQVAVPKVIDRLTSIRRAHPDNFDFDIFDFGRQFGVPQSRRRVLASRPDAIRRLRDIKIPPVSVADVLLPPLWNHDTGERCNELFSIGGNGNKNLSLRSVHDLGFTVTGNALYWASPVSTRYQKLTPREVADLQTFPKQFVLPKYKGTAYRALGNAIPPRAAQHCIRASLACECDLRTRVANLEGQIATIMQRLSERNQLIERLLSHSQWTSVLR